MQNVCDDGCIKHSSEFSCVCDEGHTVQFNELFVMMQKNRNGEPDEGVCDIQHTVHLDELFGIDEFIADGLPSAVRVCCDMLCPQNIYALCTEEHVYILVT